MALKSNIYPSNEEFLKVQADVLTGLISSNSTYMKNGRGQAKAYQLTTKQQSITPAINELKEESESLLKAVKSDLSSSFDFAGNASSFEKLKEIVQSYKPKKDRALDFGYPDDDRPPVSLAEIIIDLADRVAKSEDLAADDFEDVFHVPEGTIQTTFNLAHRPIGKIRFYIDGVRYFSDCYKYNKRTNSIIWTATKATAGETNGFDISDSTVTIEYDYDEDEET